MKKFIIPTFDKFVNESKKVLIVEEIENKTEAMRNYKAYLNGTEPLRHALLTHREGDPMYDYIKNNISDRFSVYPKGYWEDLRKRRRKAMFDVIKNRKGWN